MKFNREEYDFLILKKMREGKDKAIAHNEIIFELEKIKKIKQKIKDKKKKEKMKSKAKKVPLELPNE